MHHGTCGMQHICGMTRVCVLQPVGSGVDVFEGRPKLVAWRARVKKELGEKLFDEAHEAIMNRSALLQTMHNNPQLQLLKPKLQKLLK